MKIEANGIKVNYELAGRADAPLVMLCHSLAADLHMWDPQMSALSERYRVLRYDLRGHGATEASEGAYSFDMLADDALGLLRALRLPRCHFVGLSIGGMIGQTLGLRAPAEIASLTLCATTSRIPAEAQPMWDERFQIARSQGMRALVQPTLDRWLSQSFREREPAATERIRAAIEATPVAGYIGCGQAIRTLNLTDRIKAIRLPTLVIAGKNDPSTPLAANEVIQREIQGAEWVALDAMHICNVEQAQAFNLALLNFLQKVA